MNQASSSQSLHTYAEPLSGLRVSWGAILAGALSMMGVALILWALALAIVLTASSASADAMRADAVALSICAIVTTLIGAFIGGTLSGFLPGNPRWIIGAVHGFLAWAAAFIAVTALGGSVLRTSVLAGAMAGEGAAPAVAPTGTAEERAIGALESMGYTHSQAEAMVRSNAEGRTVVNPHTQAGGATAGPSANALVGWSAGLAWAWFGTWVLSAGIATLAGAAATRRSRSIDITDDFVSPRPRPFVEPAPVVP